MENDSKKIMQDVLKELLNNEKEIISSPLRFNGVHIQKIKDVFSKHGVFIENTF